MRISSTEHYVCGLAHLFAVRMSELGLPVFGGVSNRHASHIVTIGGKQGTGHDSPADAAMAGLYRYLIAHDVRLGVRRGLLRFSFHVYNNHSDVEQVVALCRAWQQGRRVAPAG